MFWRERRTRTFEFPSVKQANGQVIYNRCFVDVPAFNLKYDEVIYSDLPEDYLYKSEDDVIQKELKDFGVKLMKKKHYIINLLEENLMYFKVL